MSQKQTHAYNEYKDSGFEWLGQIPVHWSTLPGLAILREKQVKNTGLVEKQILSLSYGRVIVRSAERLKGLVPNSFETYQIVDPGDIIIRPTDLQNDTTSLRVGLAQIRGIITSAYLCFKVGRGMESEYVYYLLLGYDLLKIFYGLGSGLRQNLSFIDFKRLPIAIPPPNEQSAIVLFLNYATKRLDKAILAKRRSIVLLNEQKQNIIEQAISYGLDSSVSLKDSGLTLLGEVPAHWGVMQTRRVISFITSGSRGWADYYSESGYVFLQSGNLGRSMSLNLDSIQHVKPPKGAEGERTRVQRDDVLVCITGALTGNTVLVDRDLTIAAFINQHVALLRPKPSLIYPRFLAFVLYSRVGQRQFKGNEYGGTKQGLGLDDVKSVVIPVPPLAEQRAICVRLDEDLNQLTDVVSRFEREVILLREYRTRLIADVVTGKLNIQGLTFASLEGEVNIDDNMEVISLFEEETEYGLEND